MSRWTAKQREAIEAEGMNLLVAAAAGSGKTSVLVERIIRKLLDEENGIDIDELLVVTFTRAAAGEMRERIAAALNERLRAEPNSRRLQRQLVLLNAASISTFDSFCQSVVKKNFHLLDIDPRFRIAGEPELAMLRQDSLEELFEDNYSQPTAEFLAFVEAYANERGDDPLYEIILALHRFSGSQPQPELWLSRLPEAFNLPPEASFAAADWCEIILAQCRLVIAQGQAVYDELMAAAETGDFGYRLANYSEEQAQVAGLAAAADSFTVDELGWERLRAAVQAVSFGRLKAAPRGQVVDEGAKTHLDDLRNGFKTAMKELQEDYFAVSHQAVREDMAKVLPFVSELCRLTLEFDRRFAAAKRQRGIVDFNDIAHYCLAVLCQDYDASLPPEQMRPSAVASRLRDKYKEIMCDEYQDTNGVQEAILRLVSRDNNFFVVGDVKQSIYRFRSADSDLFLEKYSTYSDGGAVDRRILLAQNFRSRRSVLDGINFIFRQLMSPQVVELAYGEAEQLNAGREFTACSTSLEGPIEVKLIDMAASPEEGADEAELSALEQEAACAGRRINELLAAKTQVMDKDGSYRPLEYRDIVILLRATEGKAELFSQVLKQQNIPVYAAGGSGYFQQLEIKLLLSLLKIIDNPLQDIPLAAVLCSSVGGLEPSELAELRLSGAAASLWAAVQSCQAAQPDTSLGRRLASFTVRLDRWREFAAYHSVPELIWQLFNDTGYYEYVGGLPSGLLRQANLRLLYDRALEYERTNYRGLFRFLRFVERMQRSQTDLAAARTLGENENVVRIMSIHKSKGLEFPVVIVANIGKKFNYQDTYKSILINKRYGLGVKVVDTELGYQYPLLSHTAIACQMRQETRAEELRILYVALTRAKERLILIGSSRDLQRQAAKWCGCLHYQAELLPDYVIAAGNSYLDLLGAALIRHRDGAALREYAALADAELPPISDDSHWQIDILAGLAAEPSAGASQSELLAALAASRPFAAVAPEAVEQAEEILGYAYDAAPLQRVPAKMSVTELKRRFAELEADGQAAAVVRQQPLRRRPRFVQQQTGLSGSEFGTLLHSVMQYIDYRQPLDKASLEQQLDSLVLADKLLAEQRSLLPAEPLRRFFASKLGQRMCQASEVWRELPFSVLFPAGDFYPEVESEEETIFVQGIVDVLFAEPDGLVLVDYKTDRTSDAAELTAKYKLQLDLYAAAVSRTLKRPIKEKYIYSFSLGREILLP